MLKRSAVVLLALVAMTQVSFATQSVWSASAAVPTVSAETFLAARSYGEYVGRVSNAKLVWKKVAGSEATVLALEFDSLSDGCTGVEVSALFKNFPYDTTEAFKIGLIATASVAPLPIPAMECQAVPEKKEVLVATYLQEGRKIELQHMGRKITLVVPAKPSSLE